MGALAGLGGGLGATQVGGTPQSPSRCHRDHDEEPPGGRQAASGGLYAILGVILLGALAFGIYQLTQPDDATQVEVTTSWARSSRRRSAHSRTTASRSPTRSRRPATTSPKGEVISQDPEAGDEADKGSEVTLTVSSGPDQVTIPQLTGFKYCEAKDLLESDKYGLKVKKNEQESSAPENEVINSNPPGGTEVDKGSTVTLLVSQGQATVPNLVGLDVDDAEDALKDAGLKASVNEEPSPQPEGHRHRAVGAAGSAASTRLDDRAHRVSAVRTTADGGLVDGDADERRTPTAGTARLRRRRRSARGRR